MSSLVSSEYEMFPLISFMNTFPVDKALLLEQHRPNIILSQISDIPRELIQQLEMNEIYDSNDFLSKGQEIMYHLNLSSKVYAELLQKIIQVQQDKFQLPRLILNLPKNFAVIAITTDQSRKNLSIYWRGLRKKYVLPVHASWELIKYPLEDLIRRMNHPELIGRLVVEDYPRWLNDITPLSTYLSHLSYSRSIVDIALSWGLNRQISDLYDETDQHLIAQIFLLELHDIFTNDSRAY